MSVLCLQLPLPASGQKKLVTNVQNHTGSTNSFEQKSVSKLRYESMLGQRCHCGTILKCEHECNGGFEDTRIAPIHLIVQVMHSQFWQLEPTAFKP